jgi:hypothetical protein
MAQALIATGLTGMSYFVVFTLVVAWLPAILDPTQAALFRFGFLVANVFVAYGWIYASVGLTKSVVIPWLDERLTRH